MKKTHFHTTLLVFFLAFNASFLNAQLQEHLEIDGDARVNGVLKINDPNQTGYQLPTTDGVENQVLSTNGAGDVSWSSKKSNSNVNPQGHLGLPPRERIFFVKIDDAPSQHNLALTGLDGTEISAYGYEFQQLANSSIDCKDLQFKIRKEVDRSSPLLKAINFAQDNIQDLKLSNYTVINGSQRLENTLLIQDSTIKSIDVASIYHGDGRYQLYEEIEFNILGNVEMEHFLYDATGTLGGSIDTEFNCSN
jgi:type VI protein secretion system component Hcp